MRKETYLCDACGREFGSQAHINVKNAQVFISHQLSAINKSWHSTPLNNNDGFPIRCGEYHFCNCQCVAEWLNPKVKEVLAKLLPKEGPDDLVVSCNSDGS